MASGHQTFEKKEKNEEKKILLDPGSYPYTADKRNLLQCGHSRVLILSIKDFHLIVCVCVCAFEGNFMI